ncbi:hypothetical protein EEB14_56985 [Rhodococcus sp. WS4]|nr:hypothetical protein EEB14_56985 [Rhodococcus sp. WS4]
MNTAFTDDGWDDYTYWSTNDRKILLKINGLVKDIKRHPFDRRRCRRQELSGVRDIFARRCT